MKIFKKLGEETFLNDHWEKRPLLVKNFIDNAENLIDPNDLTGMAENEYFEARVIGKKNGAWDIKHGPIAFQNFNEVYDEWTLINHNLNLYSKELMKIQEELEFLPAWLFDDAMSTYSNEGSSVGAHIDNYNVFIVQLQGKRKWELQSNPNKEYIEDLEVKILKEFKPDTTHILEPGDMIYIPPHVAHQGTSLTDSLSLSLGFKSIEDKALVEQFAIELVNNFNSEDFYKSSFKKACSDPHLIDDETLNNIKERIIKNALNSEFIEDAILKFTTTSKRPVQEQDLDFKDFVMRAQDEALYIDEFVRFSAIKKKESFKVAFNDFEKLVNKEEYNTLKEIYAKTCEDEIYLDEYSKYTELLYSLYQKGILFFTQE